MADIFLSYAKEDLALVTSLVTLLEAKGFTTWWDRHLVSGANFSREIRTQIDEAQAVIVIWTKQSVTSDWVLAEVQRAHSREKLICTNHPELPLGEIPLPYNMLHCVGIDRANDLLDSLRKRSLHPSRPEKSWEFYEEPPDIRRRVMQKFSRIADSYKSHDHLDQSVAKDPALDVRIVHSTSYEYDCDVMLTAHTIRLHPSLHFSNFRDYQLRFLEPPDINEAGYDLFDNVIRRVAYRRKLRRFGFEVTMVVNLTPINPFLYYPEDSFFAYPFAYEETDRQILQPYLSGDADQSAGREFAASITPAGRTHSDYVVELNRYVNATIRNRYDPSRVSGEIRPLADILASGEGTSGELSVVLVNLLRSHGLAARYVSGYLIPGPDYQLRHGIDAGWEVFYSAWVQTYVPGGGWIGLDPMTGLLTAEEYVPLACGPRLTDTSVLTGYREDSRVSLTVNLKAAPTSRSLRFGSE